MKIKSLKLSVFIFCLLFITTGCNKDDESDYSVGQIIEITCGGTVVNFLTGGIFGEEWENYFSNPVSSYANCVLAGNLSEGDYINGDTIYFHFEKVETFSNGNFCDIGGLPKIKIEITEFCTK